MKHVLTALQGGFQLHLLLPSLAQFPLVLVDHVLLDSYLVQLLVELSTICVEGVCSRAVIGKDLGLEDGLVFLLV